MIINVRLKDLIWVFAGNMNKEIRLCSVELRGNYLSYKLKCIDIVIERIVFIKIFIMKSVQNVIQTQSNVSQVNCHLLHVSA